ncbi:hypothetical protein EXU57_02835 [Segetibacter sp. 3557_3]|nr:hypothetical protein EXU57_02835 [Segetibacter sp. 3557_3]
MNNRRRFFGGLLFVAAFIGTSCGSQVVSDSKAEVQKSDTPVANAEVPAKPALDTAAYDRIMKTISNGDTTGLWPPKAPYPLPGAVLPFNRIIAYYGNLFSTRMGILGELPKAQMLNKLKGEVAKWQRADTSIPVIPALHYIAVTAQGSPGKDGKHRLRMPFHQIDTIVNWAKEIDALVFIDIQVGLSNVQTEVPQFEKYLQMPQVHFGIDPEFSMKGGGRPGSRIGTFSEQDINATIDYLAGLVRKHNLPPKILVVHRFTQGMVTGYNKIKKTPEVQVVMDMDGWGNKTLKRSTWLRYIYREPVMFAGFKLFYKNDTKTGQEQLYSPEELIRFTPQPMYIQYQ